MASVDELLCGTVATTVVCSGTLFVFSMAVALIVIAIPRHTFALEKQRELSRSDLTADPLCPNGSRPGHPPAQRVLPKCGVVMPVKGVHAQSYTNWHAQVNSSYGGALEFFFCVESSEDPACPHIERLIAEHPHLSIQLLVAGLSWHCSQKIHNQLFGFERAMRSCEYVMVIDDDIKLHSGSILRWVEEMEADPCVLTASGYAFEYVPPGELGWASFCAMLWRLNASTGFNEPKHDRPVNVWGGAMMFRASELRENIYGLIDAWRDGGYSEDFITISMVRYHGRTIAVPKEALFPNEISGVRFDQFWNFLCRQIFVLTQTYATGAQRVISIPNFVMNAAFHMCIALAALIVAPLSIHVLGTAAWTLIRCCISPADVPHLTVLSSHERRGELALAPALAALGLGGNCASGGAVSVSFLFWLGLMLCGAAGKMALQCFANLCNVLSPHGFRGRYISEPAKPINVDHISPGRLAAAYVLYSVLVPSATIATLFRSAIVWSGVRFHMVRGRVARMYRMDTEGRWYTLPAARSIEESLKATAEYRRTHTMNGKGS